MNSQRVIGNTSSLAKAMPEETAPEDQLIAWNGALITIPASWEPHVAGNCHLIFEKDFQPLVEIRWENNLKVRAGNFSPVLKKFKKQTQSKIFNGRPPRQWQQFEKKFETICYTSTDDQVIDGGVWFCTTSKTLILFRLFPGNSRKNRQVIPALNTLLFSPQTKEAQWRIQDFSLATPPSFSLIDYTFAPGLTRLSFHAPNLSTQICRLAPADSRLVKQPLDTILLTLVGMSKYPAEITQSADSCELSRIPKIWQQIILRFRREKPFVFAKLWHDTVHNRLLAVVFTSRRPIPVDIASTLCQNYEIVQDQSTGTTTHQA